MTIHADYELPVKSVFEALTDPGFLTDRNLALGELSSECEAERSKGRIVVSAVREVRRNLPGALAKLFNPLNVMDMTEQWDAKGNGWKGHWTLEVRDQPVTIFGSFELTPTETGCRYSVSHRVKVNIPFVGRQVQKYILGQTAKGATDELEYLRTYLNTSIA